MSLCLSSPVACIFSQHGGWVPKLWGPFYDIALKGSITSAMLLVQSPRKSLPRFQGRELDPSPQWEKCQNLCSYKRPTQQCAAPCLAWGGTLNSGSDGHDPKSLSQAGLKLHHRKTPETPAPCCAKFLLEFWEECYLLFRSRTYLTVFPFIP